MFRFVRWVSILVAVAGLVGCGRRGETVTVAGSTAFQPFAEKLAEQFMQQRPDVTVTVQGGGSALGIQAALSGTAQIGMADLVELPPDAKGLSSLTVARDGICVVIHPSNPVTDLTTDQIRDLYNGKIRNWKDLGGKDQPITLVSREAGSGTRSSFERIVRDISLTPDAIIQDSNGTIRETVANDPNAVGYLSHGLVNDRIKALSVDGMAGTVEAITAGRYPLVRPVFFLTRGEPAGGAKAYVDYVLSAEGQTCIRENGLIPAK
jgi:phosphate transport system substrate-binding protein